MTWMINRVRIAQVFSGWTLEYIDGLDPFDLTAVLGVMDGDAKLRAK